MTMYLQIHTCDEAKGRRCTDWSEYFLPKLPTQMNLRLPGRIIIILTVVQLFLANATVQSRNSILQVKMTRSFRIPGEKLCCEIEIQ